MNDYRISPERAALQKSVRDSLVFKPQPAAYYHDQAMKTRASLLWIKQAQAHAEDFARSYREALGVTAPPEPEIEPDQKEKPA